MLQLILYLCKYVDINFELYKGVMHHNCTGLCSRFVYFRLNTYCSTLCLFTIIKGSWGSLQSFKRESSYDICLLCYHICPIQGLHTNGRNQLCPIDQRNTLAEKFERVADIKG